MKEKRERADGRETREAILAAASAEFAEKGFALGSMRAICADAGVNSALASRYFGSKEGLYKVVAKRLFGDLGEPLAALAKGVTTAAEWKTALKEWIDDFLFMTIPTEKAQRLCAGLFRHEVTAPTKFHGEFKRDFGKPVYDALRDLLAMALDDKAEIVLWASSIWAQVSVYALADKKWHESFQPKGVKPADWRAKVRAQLLAATPEALRDLAQPLRYIATSRSVCVFAPAAAIEASGVTFDTVVDLMGASQN